jgi:hypothetical protein
MIYKGFEILKISKPRKALQISLLLFAGFETESFKYPENRVSSSVGFRWF